jgi:hypothetical protein
MKTIHNNPFRVAGILSNASARELQKQKAKIRAYTKVGKELTFDVDFSMLARTIRTEDSTNKAFSKIEQNQDRVFYALFWFLKTTPFDETALNYLSDGNMVKAYEIWSRVTSSRVISSKNFSALNNLGTLQLLSRDQDTIQKGIESKIKLIESAYFEDFVHAVADETFSINNESQIKKFIDEVLIQFKGTYNSEETFDLFSTSNGITQKYLLKKITEEPIHNIEIQIEKAKRKRKENQNKSNKYGANLYMKTRSELISLRSILGFQDLKYKLIADNLAKEIMQCGIDYFQEWKEINDPSEEGLKLLKYAQSIAVGTQTKDRIKENIEGMKEWAETAPIKEDLEFIGKKLQSFQNQSNSISNANALISSCKPKLQNIKNIIGSRDELYLQFSSVVANLAMGMVVFVVNNSQEGIQYDRSKLLRLPDIVSSAVSALNTIGLLDMDSNVRRRYTQNKSGINNLNTQLQDVKRQIAASSSSNNSSEGCYIATMVYEDYDHPQVIKLRIFRDNVLSKNIFGRSFIKFYYTYSPKLVQKLKSKKVINALIKKSLDLFIKTKLTK